jgi:hypothetical protein
MGRGGYYLSSKELGHIVQFLKVDKSDINNNKDQQPEKFKFG